MRYAILIISILIPSLVFSNIIHQDNFNNCSSISWNSVAGASDSESFDEWKCTTYFGRTYMEIYDGDGNNDDDWLISPAFNLDNYENEYFSFEYDNASDISGLTLLYSTDYSGANTAAAIANATWNSLDLDIFDIDNDSYTSNFSFHKAISLNNISGTSVYLAFHFTSTSSTQGWSIDNVRLETNYYQNIDSAVDAGVRCVELKTMLHKLIRGHQRIEYTDSSYDVWDAFYATDRRLNDAGTDWIVNDMYSDNPSGAEPYEFTLGLDKDIGISVSTEGIYYNREHVFPKSWWGGNTTPLDSQYTDIHHVVPSDKVVNSMKSNYPMGETLIPTVTSVNGCKQGNSSLIGYNDIVFTPIEEYKGDFARILLYFITRYQFDIPSWSSNYPDIMSNDSYTSFEPWLLENLLCWHELDPVSAKEIERNNAVYSIQKNRNPFIDNPDYVEFIWGTCGSVQCTPTLLPVELSSFEGKAMPNQQNLLTWKTASEINSSHFDIQHSTDGIRFKSVGNQNAQGSSSKNSSYEFVHENAAKGINYYRLESIDIDGQSKLSETISIEHTSQKWIDVFPTIVHENIQFKYTDSQQALDIKIYDLQGNLISQYSLKDNTNSSIDLKHLSSGMYFIHCQLGSLVETKRIFVK